jgi:hypothetical protein
MMGGMSSERPIDSHAAQAEERKLVAQQLAPQVYLFVTSSADNRTYRLDCRTAGCYSLGKISAAKHEKLTDRVTLRVAKTFVGRGWRYDGGPVCPECAKGYFSICALI